MGLGEDVAVEDGETDGDGVMVAGTDLLGVMDPAIEDDGVPLGVMDGERDNDGVTDGVRVSEAVMLPLRLLVSDGLGEMDTVTVIEAVTDALGE